MTDTTTTAPRFLIRKYGGFYRPNSQGYTGSAIQAGRYTLDEAENITHPNGPDGPRDGMTFIHEDDLADDDWKAYAALLAERDALAAQLTEMTRRRDEWKAKAEGYDAMAAAVRAKIKAEPATFSRILLRGALTEAENRAEALAAQLATARGDALEEAAKVARTKPMRFAGQTEGSIRENISAAILALVQPKGDA